MVPFPIETPANFIYPCKVTLHSMAYFEAAYHYNKRHNALEDATWIDLVVVRGFPRTWQRVMS